MCTTYFSIDLGAGSAFDSLPRASAPLTTWSLICICSYVLSKNKFNKFTNMIVNIRPASIMAAYSEIYVRWLIWNSNLYFWWQLKRVNELDSLATNKDLWNWIGCELNIAYPPALLFWLNCLTQTEEIMARLAKEKPENVRIDSLALLKWFYYQLIL